MSYEKDVFVSYHQSDEDWVRHQLLPRLEAGRLTYIEQRQFMLGKPRLNELGNAIAMSRFTLLINSKKYLDDAWNAMENDMASSFSLESRRWSVVPVVIESDLTLPPRLEMLVSVNLCAPTEQDWTDFILKLSAEPTRNQKNRDDSTGEPGAARDGLSLLVELMSNPQVKAALSDCRKDFEDLCIRLTLLNAFKRLHDKFQDVESSFNLFVNFARPDANGLMAWEHLLIPAIDLADGFQQLITNACESAFAEPSDPWVSRLGRAILDLTAATTEKDVPKLRSAIRIASQVFDTIPSKLNGRMYTEAKSLRLTFLSRALRSVRDVLAGLQPTPGTNTHLEQIEKSANRIEEMDIGLRTILYVHDSLQQIDNELRRVEATLDDDVMQVAWLWSDLKPKMQILGNNNSSQWATDLIAAGTQLERSLPREPHALRVGFRMYRNQVTRSFNRVDSDMLNRCKELNEEVSKPLTPLLTLLQAQSA